ncbi:MAG: TonB-dependent receptor [Kangiellaceae bacterium]|nr:TonB-dependent receptor [Kangiellaceae bacterium]
MTKTLTSLRKRSSLIFILLSFPVMAEQSMDLFYDMSLEQLLKVKVTGSTMTEENIRTVPSAATVFTHEQIKLLGLDSLHELMSLVPGFQSFRSSSLSFLTPFSSRGQRAGNVSLVLVDGQRMQDARNGDSAGVIFDFPLARVERVEFLRGPGSAIYGSNAMSGVINIITRSEINEIVASYGSFKRHKISASASMQLGQLQLDFFGRYDTDNGEDYSVQDNFSSNRINTDDPRELTELNIKLRRSDTQLNVEHREVGVQNFYVVDRLSNGFNKTAASYSSVSLKQEFEWHAVSSWAYFGFSRSQLYSDVQITAPGELFEVSGGISEDAVFGKTDLGENSELRLQLHNDIAITDKSSLQFGFEYRHLDVSDVVSRRNFDLGALAVDDIPIASSDDFDFASIVQSSSLRDISGAYGQYQKQIFEQTQLTVGLRYDYFSSIEGQFTPRFDLIHNVNKHHTIKLLYGEAFRAPTENELNLEANSVLLGNKNLESESVQSWDIIWVAHWTQSNLSIGYFSSKFEDSIIPADIGGGLRQYQNDVGISETHGIELELSYKPSSNWLFHGTYSGVLSKPDSGFLEADRSASLMMNFRHNAWNMNFVAAYRGISEMATNNSSNDRIRLNAQWHLNSKVVYEFDLNLQGYVQLKNLLDEELLSAPSGLSLTEGIPSRGREILVGATWRF